MLRVSLEELSALNTILHFCTVADLLDAAKIGFVEKENCTEQNKELSDMCWKLSKTLR